MADIDDCRARIKTIWLALDPPTELTDELGQNVLDKIVDGFAMLAASGLAEPDPATLRGFRRAGRAATWREIDAIADVYDEAAAKLKGRIADLHQPAIVALADIGILRSALHRSIAQNQASAQTVRRAKDRVPADAASPARPRNVRAQLVAGLTVRGYEELWAVRSDLPYTTPRLVALVGEMFGVLGIKANPRRTVATVAEQLHATRETGERQHPRQPG